MLRKICCNFRFELTVLIVIRRDMVMKNRTIAAVCTPAGVGGLAVIRISGEEAFEIADKVFRGKIKLSEAKTHTIHHGFVVDDKEQKVDEVMAAVMRAPRTFTCEDVVEITTHGGIRASHGVMHELIRAGASPAEGGEFTKRAFLNGRIDLSQAEAVIDIINAKTELASKNALSQAEGTLFRGIEEIRNELVGLAAAIQVTIDYPDEDLNDLSDDDILSKVTIQKHNVNELLKTAQSGRVISEGILTAIVGRPNVGKSSLLNCLAHEQRAIVTDIAGTTRDIIKETVNLDGILLNLLDTAGIRSTDDEIEKIGVERSRRSIEEADLVLVVLDARNPLNQIDLEILEDTSAKNRVVLVNKTDVAEPEFLSQLPDDEEIICISAKTGDGISKLAELLKNRYNLGAIGQNDACVITNLRHVSALSKAKDALKRMKDDLLAGTPTDLVTIDLNIAIDALGEITGTTVSEDIVNSIFHNFCVGK